MLVSLKGIEHEYLQDEIEQSHRTLGRLKLTPMQILVGSSTLTATTAMLLLAASSEMLRGSSVFGVFFVASVFLNPTFIYISLRQMIETGWNWRLLVSAVVSLLGLGLWVLSLHTLAMIRSGHAP